MKRAAARRPTAGTIAEYLAGLPAGSRALLRRVRKTIRAAAPGADESISYGIPTFKQDAHRLIYFSAASDHCTIHMIRKEHLDEATRLGFRVGRGSIQFTPDHPLPTTLLTRIVKARLAEIASKSKRGAHASRRT